MTTTSSSTSTSYSDNGSMGKPPKFDPQNFSMWKSRMIFFLESADSYIPEIIRNGPHIPLTLLPSTPTNPPVVVTESS